MPRLAEKSCELISAANLRFPPGSRRHNTMIVVVIIVIVLRSPEQCQRCCSGRRRRWTGLRQQHNRFRCGHRSRVTRCCCSRIQLRQCWSGKAGCRQRRRGHGSAVEVRLSPCAARAVAGVVHSWLPVAEQLKRTCLSALLPHSRMKALSALHHLRKLLTGLPLTHFLQKTGRQKSTTILRFLD